MAYDELEGKTRPLPQLEALLRSKLALSLAEAARPIPQLENHAKILPELAECRQALKKISKALTAFDDDPARIESRFEETMPLGKGLAGKGFSEALFSVIDKDGNPTPVPEILDAINTVEFGEQLGQRFRLWLVAAQIAEFYRNHGPKDRLSVNILPGDIDSDEFYGYLSEILQSASDKGYKGIVLEAVETEPWHTGRCEKMKSLLQKGAADLAIDDYGAPEGSNDLQSIRNFLSGSKIDGLIIKLDGQIVRPFISGESTDLVDRVREAKEAFPNAVFVAEWITSADDAKDFIMRLEEHGLESDVHFVQGRDLKDGARTFLNDLALSWTQDRRRPPAPPKMK